MTMFYSKLRWKIKDLEEQLKEANEGKNHWRNAYNEKYYGYMTYEKEVRVLREAVSKLAEEKKQLLSDVEVLNHDLDMAGQQFEAANEEIKRLQEENDRLQEQLRKKGGCPCDKRRKH